MMKNLFKLTLLLLTSTAINAQTMNTNVEGLVIKNFFCQPFNVRILTFDVINRNNTPYTGSVRVKVIDNEDDILWQTSNKISVGGKNGISLTINIQTGTCMQPNRVAITLEN